MCALRTWNGLQSSESICEGSTTESDAFLSKRQLYAWTLNRMLIDQSMFLMFYFWPLTIFPTPGPSILWVQVVEQSVEALQWCAERSVVANPAFLHDLCRDYQRIIIRNSGNIRSVCKQTEETEFIVTK